MDKKKSDDLIIANKELAFQNDEKEKRAAELIVANKELAFQNEEKEKRAAELSIANKELAFQTFQKALLDTAGAMIIATDEEGIIKLFNPEASLNIGYHESEVININTPVLFHDKTEIARKRKELLNRIWNNN